MAATATDGAGELPALLEKLSAEERRAWHSAHDYLQQPRRAVVKWLESRGLALADVQPRTEPRGTIYKRLVKLGYSRDEQFSWRKRFRSEFSALDPEGLTRLSVQELSYWFMEAVLTQHPPQPALAKRLSIKGADYLPPDMRWVYHHPGLTFSAEELTVPITARIEDYERVSPCPSQGAQNMFFTLRGNKKETMSFFKECVRLHYEHVKKQNKDAAPDELGGAEDQRILSLEEMLKTG